MGFLLAALGDPWEQIFADLGMTFGTQNTRGYGSGSPTSGLVLSLNAVKLKMHHTTYTSLFILSLSFTK